jgi:drug/metabolite transporter (DMT)-like permease
MSNDKSLKGHAAVLVANILWGAYAPICKAVLAEFSAFSVIAFRALGAATAFWLLSLFLPQEHVNPKDMLRLFFASLFGVVFNQSTSVIGLSLTSPIDASIVATVTPITTMIVAALYLHEPITNKKVLGIFIGGMGALALILDNPHSTGGGSNHLLGNVFCLISQLSFAVYLTVFKDLVGRYSPITINKWLFIYAAICFIPFSYRDIATVNFTSISPEMWVRIGYVVLGATFLAFICTMIGQRLLRPTVVSMYNYIQPIVAATIAVAWGMDTFGWQKGIAVALVFLGVYFVTKSKSKAQLEKESH